MEKQIEMRNDGNYCYITVLSSDSYLNGVLTLAKSLEKVNSKYPLVVLVPNDLDGTTYTTLLVNGIDFIIENRDLELPAMTEERNVRFGLNHWNKTFFKLFIFDKCQFDKMVYIDSDMMVCENIDSLFECPNMSAVVAGGRCKGNEGWTKLNSGLMIIEPRECLTDELVALLPKVAIEHDNFGDQEVIQEYFSNWENEDALHLDDKYNMFANHVDYYSMVFGYGYNNHLALFAEKPPTTNIAVAHFITSKKPWMYSKLEILAKYCKLLLKGKVLEIRLLYNYRKLMGLKQ